jgi:dipeptidase
MEKVNMKHILITTLILGLNFTNIFGQNEIDLNCFTIIVGKNASIDGSVFIAHNEDNPGINNFVDLHKVPRIKHKADERQIFKNGKDSMDEVTETYAYFWITGSHYLEEQYLNEWGLAITSNSARSKAENGNGNIDHNLRRLLAERARTAREAVKLAGSLIEKYGYASSGRAYSIADPKEAWVFEAVNGKHWIARRVPDDEVVIIPNYYVIDSINLSDTLNFLSSPDIIEYAVSNNWYDPKTDKAFNFRLAYARKNRLDAFFNIARKWIILNMLSEKQYNLHDNFPFSFKPKQKVNIPNLMDAMQNHYENTEFEQKLSYKNRWPHFDKNTMVRDDSSDICNIDNDYCCITQLRDWLPAEIGNVMWIAPRYPCIQPFIPWYYGITKIPPDYEKANYTDALQNYNNKERDYKTMYPDHACWIFDEYAAKVDSNYRKEIKSIREWKNRFQTEIFNEINKKEKDLIKIYQSEYDKVLQTLTDLTNGFAEKVLLETKDKIKK